MRQDKFGQNVRIADATALSAWNKTMMGFMAHAATTPTHLAATLDAAPGFALGHATKGLFLMLLGRRELLPAAQEALGSARAAMDETTPCTREAAFVDALDAALAGAPTRSVACLEAHLADHPEDALAAKLSHAIRFVVGDAEGMRRSIERVLPACGPDHPALGYLRGCHAFTLEETGDYVAAEAAGRAGLELAPDDAWGLHAVTHVYDMTGNARAGLGWLEGREDAWAHCNNFRFHVWWHKALLHLDCGEYDTALALYDSDVRAEKTDDYRDISNGASLLMRLELDGVDVGTRWEELAELSAARTEDGCLIFADLHYLMALVGGGGRETAVADMAARLYRDARAPVSENEQRMARPGLPAAAGLAAFGDEDYATAFRHLRIARTDMQLAGGSHAQRDVFERLCIDSGLRAGLFDAASAVLDDRQRRRGGRADGYARARRAIIAEARRVPA